MSIDFFTLRPQFYLRSQLKPKFIRVKTDKREKEYEMNSDVLIFTLKLKSFSQNVVYEFLQEFWLSLNPDFLELKD